MAINSCKTEQEITMNSFSFPNRLYLNNYFEAWKTAHLGNRFINSIIVSIVAMVVTVLLGALVSYFIARFQFKWKNILYVIFIFGMLVPIHGTLVPMFILMRKIGLINTRWALIFPYIGFNLPLTIFILVSYMKGLPTEVEEAAVVDGCGIFKIFWSFILPMSRPALATVSILNFIFNWNEFSFALVLINSDSLKTIPLGLASFAGKYSTNYGVQMAALTMVLIPIIIFYLIMEEHLIKGMSSGAVKG
nr:carbohydrate ABC transporter permease [Halothermothrix orenii]